MEALEADLTSSSLSEGRPLIPLSVGGLTTLLPFTSAFLPVWSFSSISSSLDDTDRIMAALKKRKSYS